MSFAPVFQSVNNVFLAGVADEIWIEIQKFPPSHLTASIFAYRSVNANSLAIGGDTEGSLPLMYELLACDVTDEGLGVYASRHMQT